MKTINVQLKENSYEIVVERGLLKNLGTEIEKLCKPRKLAVVTDDNIYNLYGKAIESALSNFKTYFIIINPGETSKSIEVLTEVYKKLLSFNITRSDLIIAFGGGVVGDLTGFAASTYLRGIDYIQCPTSLLAQIDSSIGGKVAVNLDEGKNLIGSFYQPKKVFIDPDVLNTLPEKYIKDGLGEVIKYACIKDSNFFEYLMAIKTKEQLFDCIEHVIYTCCFIKKDLVERDEHDNGERMLLNFGHTLGHAIEKYFNYEYSHGEAVALGMHYITKKSQSLGYTEPGTSEKLKEILDNFNIKSILPEMNMDEIIKTIYLDKKNISGKINLILLKKIGESFIESVPIEIINKFFEENL